MISFIFLSPSTNDSTLGAQSSTLKGCELWDRNERKKWRRRRVEGTEKWLGKSLSFVYYIYTHIPFQCVFRPRATNYIIMNNLPFKSASSTIHNHTSIHIWFVRITQQRVFHAFHFCLIFVWNWLFPYAWNTSTVLGRFCLVLLLALDA